MRFFKGIVCCSIMLVVQLHAIFEFRSPLSLEDRGYMHWILGSPDNPGVKAWWYDPLTTDVSERKWNIHLWAGAFSRTADRAFFDSCNPDKITRDTATLSQLFFDKQVFRGENIFVGGTFAGAPTATQVLVNSINPFLAFARIMPKFDYNEQGADMGIDFARYVGRDNRWHVGGRVNIPFKIIEIEQDSNYTLQETLDDVFVTRVVDIQTNAAPGQIEYAMRFDFLSTLVFNTTAIPSGANNPRPVVVYSDSGTPAANITLVGQQLCFPNSGSAANDTVPAAYATKIDTGDIPLPPFRRQPSEVTAALGPDGQGTNGDVLFFETGVDYAGNLQNDRNAQGTLFITPRSNAAGNLEVASATILTQVQNLINADLLISEPVSVFFTNNNINLAAYERIVGIGDLATEIYGGIGHYDDWYVDGIFGIQFPTGKRQPTSNRLYYKPTGNNGHVEIKLGIDAGWKPRRWFAFEIDAAFFHACKRSEKRAAPFTGATVINIGPEIDMNVSWNYFVLRTDFSFFHPRNSDLGFVLGYELFAKGNDHVSTQDDQTTATDLLGRTNQPLAPCNYEKNSNSFSNKLRGQIFHRWNYFELFGGGSQMVSGRCIMKETEGHIGFAIYF
jgi:hypothetical protein